ncbi:phosphotransferase [Kribbella antibiotica]|uniref:Phosphotransferase n=1 Tax=Kribbella antibiotica TaxID=190195 RepID=A0A4R4ZTP8_9ACTN|nr:aminoglycoside phosphotransferase family protein [Kribbella antibiotica]TDD62215.1 phosphotransferase [Kribbella antibiotica]
MVAKLHDDEVEINASILRQLLTEQFPQWADKPIEVVTSSGTDHIAFRVGSELVARLPRTERMQGQVEKDLTWLPRLAPQLPLAIPEPLAIGVPGAGYPLTWGVYRWLDGETFNLDQLKDPLQAARDLAGFIRELQKVDTSGAPLPPTDDPFSRGTPLKPRDALFREALDQLRDEFDTELVLAAWDASLAADTYAGPPVWVHGDLMEGNLLVADGKLSAVIDFGTARAADPAADVMPAWWLFEGAARQAFREALGVDPTTWTRARGWALSLSMIAIPYYRTRRPDPNPGEHPFITDLLNDFKADC